MQLPDIRYENTNSLTTSATGTTYCNASIKITGADGITHELEPSQFYDYTIEYCNIRRFIEISDTVVTEDEIRELEVQLNSNIIENTY